MVLVAPALAEERMGRGGRDVKLVPYHRFELTSPMSSSEALQAMAAHVEPEQWIRIGRSDSDAARFEGTETTNGFRVRRIIGYRNSFLPVLNISIHNAGGLSRIAVSMRPFIFVMVFMSVWFAAAASGLFTSAGRPFSLAMLCFGYALTMGGFWFEASKQEGMLREIFRAM